MCGDFFEEEPEAFLVIGVSRVDHGVGLLLDFTLLFFVRAQFFEHVMGNTFASGGIALLPPKEGFSREPQLNAFAEFRPIVVGMVHMGKVISSRFCFNVLPGKHNRHLRNVGESFARQSEEGGTAVRIAV